jgi:hypothetical protein
MLLELLNHHFELLRAAIRPLILRRDCRSLSALAGCCKSICDFILNTDFWKHQRGMINVFRSIKNIGVLCNEHLTIRHYEKITVYDSIRLPNSAITYTINNSDKTQSCSVVLDNGKYIMLDHPNRYDWHYRIYIKGVIPEWVIKNVPDYFTIESDPNGSYYGAFDVT